MAGQSRALTLQSLESLGGAQEIVRTHLDGALRNFSREERYVVADLFHQLVTPSGTKIAHSAEDLAEYVALPVASVTLLLEKLAAADTRIVRAVAPPPGDAGASRYEIFHDVLAPSILDWRSRQSASRRARAQFRRRVLRLLAGLGAGVIALIVWLAISAINARDRADIAAAQARSEQHRAEVVSRQFSAQSRQYKLLAQRNAGLAAIYNHQRLVARFQKRRADENATRAGFLAGVATTQAARANQLAAANAAQAMRESALAAVAQRNAVAAHRSANAAQHSAAAAQLSLVVETQAADLSSISPDIVVCTDIASNPGFTVAALRHAPPSATAFFVGGGQTLTGHTGAQFGTIHFSAAETGCVAGVTPAPNQPSFSFGDTVTMYVVLPDLAWMYQGQFHAIQVPNASGPVASFRLVKQQTCRTPGSRAQASQVPLQCPRLP